MPELRRNLLSAGALGRQGIHLTCAGQQAHLFHAQSGDEIGQARRIDEGSEYNLYRIDPVHNTSPLHTALLACQSNTDTEHDIVRLWHRRLGHSNARRIRQLFSAGSTADGHRLQNRIKPDTPPQQLQPDRHCDSCAICKQHAPTRPLSIPEESRAQRPLEIVHIDLRGPHSPGIKQELYQLLIVDESTRHAVGYTLKSKNDALASFTEFAMAANNFYRAKGHTIKFVRCDNGGEFIGDDWKPLLTRLGIQRQRTSPYTPHQNGIVERLNRTIGESTRTMLHAAGLPDRFWPLACQAAVYLNNRLPSKATGTTTPYQRWYGKRPHIGHLRTFGCLAYALTHAPGKLDNRATRCTFVGYTTDSSLTYLLWDDQNNKLTRSGQVHFIESINGWNYNPRQTAAATAGEATAGEAAAGEEQISRALMNHASDLRDAAAIPGPAQPPAVPAQPPADIGGIDPIDQAPDSPSAAAAREPPPEQLEQPEPEPRAVRVNRAQQNQLRLLQDNLRPAIHDLEPVPQVTDAMLQADRPQLRAGPRRQHYYGSAHTTQQAAADDGDSEEPHTYQQATNSPHRNEWLAAIRNELNSLIKARTWRYVHKPTAANLVGCKWVFKIKRDKDGNISKFKARLVAKGFTQVHGVDYTETYAPVARYSSIRLIIALAAHYGWELHQLSTMTTLLAHINSNINPNNINQPTAGEPSSIQLPATSHP